MYAAGATIDQHLVTVTGNTADGGAGGKAGTRGTGPDGSPGSGEGGDLYIDAAAAVCVDAFTQGHFKKNQVSTSDRDIHGAYTTCP